MIITETDKLGTIDGINYYYIVYRSIPFLVKKDILHTLKVCFFEYQVQYPDSGLYSGSYPNYTFAEDNIREIGKYHNSLTDYLKWVEKTTDDLKRRTQIRE